MNNRKETLLNEIDQISESIAAGCDQFTMPTIAACRMMLEIIGQVAHGAILPLQKGFGRKKDTFTIVDHTPSDRLKQKLTGLFSPNNCMKLCKETLGFSQVRSSIVRHCRVLGHLGCFLKEGRDMVLKTKEQAEREKAEGKFNAKAGQFLKGENLGKKHCTEIFELDLRRLLIVAAALIRRIKEEPTEYGNDAWDEFMPSHSCGFLAHLWNKVIGVGTIFGGWEDWEEVDEVVRPTREESTAELQRKINGLEQLFDDETDRLQQLRNEGRKGSPWFWQTYNNIKAELGRLRRLLAARSWTGEVL